MVPNTHTLRPTMVQESPLVCFVGVIKVTHVHNECTSLSTPPLPRVFSGWLETVSFSLHGGPPLPWSFLKLGGQGASERYPKNPHSISDCLCAPGETT